jgi:type III pantothenate kinase
VLEERRLFIDVGNTSIKSALYDPVKDAIGSIMRYGDINELNILIDNANHVYLSNVGKEHITDHIQALCNSNNSSLTIATTKKDEFGLTNSYLTPSNMGVDRWLAMLACMKISSNKTFLVVDIGTAMTIDAVKNGNHLGGLIVPGISLLKQSLFKNTSRVFTDNEKSSSTCFGNDTPRCVNNGCTAQILGTLLMAEREIKNNVDKYEIFLTGGDKSIFLNFDIPNIIERENLVLEGLTLLVD